MSEQTAISVRAISKKYRLFGSPKERFLETLHPFKKKYHKEFWALNNISLDIPKGTTLGVIGRNGSGKSTLLQIICSILTPTLGEVVVNGKVSALLELGAGFNPDITGRENILIFCSLMGYSRVEIEKSFPLIEEFADIGVFIDQPVKTYSSGMFVRLAFSCAININPDILVVDEALAVGDAKFQSKCFRKFSEFQKEGKTIILVSHDINAIVRHCDKALILDKGHLVRFGKTIDIVRKYNEMLTNDQNSGIPAYMPLAAEDKLQGQVNVVCDLSHEEFEHPALKGFLTSIYEEDRCLTRNSYNPEEYRYGNKQSLIIDYLLVCGADIDPTVVQTGSWVDIYLKVFVKTDVLFPMHGFSVMTVDGVVIYGSNVTFKKVVINPIDKGSFVIYRISLKLNLNAGHYFITQGVGERAENSLIFMDTRNSLIHLQIVADKQFDGLVQLESHFMETCRTRRTFSGIDSE